jgi:hypothetical protein
MLSNAFFRIGISLIFLSLYLSVSSRLDVLLRQDLYKRAAAANDIDIDRTLQPFASTHLRAAPTHDRQYVPISQAPYTHWANYFGLSLCSWNLGTYLPLFIAYNFFFVIYTLKFRHHLSDDNQPATILNTTTTFSSLFHHVLMTYIGFRASAFSTFSFFYARCSYCVHSAVVVHSNPHPSLAHLAHFPPFISFLVAS